MTFFWIVESQRAPRILFDFTSRSTTNNFYEVSDSQGLLKMLILLNVLINNKIKYFTNVV
jgi:predicted ATPase